MNSVASQTFSAQARLVTLLLAGTMLAAPAFAQGVQPPAVAPTVPVPAAAPDPERVAFEAYKHQWETVFADDPAQRLAHPEVAAYYQQMEAYFAQKQTHEQNTA